MYYAIFPAIVGGVVTGIRKDQGFGSWAAESLIHELAGSWVGLRDMADAVVNSKDFSAGVVSTAGRVLTDLSRDIKGKEFGFSRQHAGKTALHIAELGGMLSGLTNAQEGRMAEFLVNWANGQEHPKGWADIGKGLWKGTLREHPQTRQTITKRLGVFRYRKEHRR